MTLQTPSPSDQGPENPLDQGGHVLGNLYIYGGSTPQASIATTFLKMTGFMGNGPASTPGVIEPDYANNRILIKKAGAYKATFSVSYSGTANATFDFVFYVNGVVYPYGGLQRKIGAGGDVGAAAADTPIQLEVDDYVEIYVKSDQGGGASLTPVYASFTLDRSGD
jgi:hypothetical protein